ncbi:MAG: hypothetical protein OXP66_11350 [Candidatus Tectomicrobia bacterium]|nr:hypothetical protein [Candidatus Tectomicrobia bacterium]
MSRRNWFLWFLALALAVTLGDFQGYEADAGTMTGGAGIRLSGLDKFAKTVDKYAKGNLGKMVGMIIAMAGIACMAFQKIGIGLTSLGAGIALAFVPNIIGTAFNTTAASPLSAVASFVPWASGGGVLNSLAQVGLAALWPLAVLLKYVRDPVVWLSLTLVAVARPSLVARSAGCKAQSLGRAAVYVPLMRRVCRVV